MSVPTVPLSTCLTRNTIWRQIDMDTRSEKKLPSLFDASSITDSLDISPQHRAGNESEDTPKTMRTAAVKDRVQMAISTVTVKVFTRHSAGCPKHGDIYWRDCRC